MSNVAAGTFKKETIFAASGLTSGLISHLDLALTRTSTSDWKDFPTTLPLGQGNSMAWRQGFPKRSLQNSETAWLGELKEPIFWPVLGWSSVSNVAAGTFKKETIFAASGLTSGLISHLDLALRRTSTSDWKDFPTTLPSGQGNSMAWRQGFPKRSLQNSETAWPGELKEPIFWPVLGWSSVSNVAAGTAKKRDDLCRCRTYFRDLCWGDLQCQTLRPEPIKKGGFAALGCNLHLQLPSKYTVGTFGCVWISRPAKPRLLTQKPSQKGCLRNRETAWSGELNDTVFRPVLGWSSMSNVAAGIYKKRRFCSFGAQFAPPIAFEIHRWHLRLRLGITTGKTTTSDPKAFPKRLPPEQGWRSPFFDLCWGDLQCQTLRPEPLKKRRFVPLQDLLPRPVLGWSSMSNAAPGTDKKRRFCSFGVQFAPPIAFEIHRWHLRLRLDITTGKTTTSDPKAFPKRLPPEQGNSMVWRAQWHRFSTCAGVIFNVKRCGRNL